MGHAAPLSVQGGEAPTRTGAGVPEGAGHAPPHPAPCPTQRQGAPERTAGRGRTQLLLHSGAGRVACPQFPTQEGVHSTFSFSYFLQ